MVCCTMVSLLILFLKKQMGCVFCYEEVQTFRLRSNRSVGTQTSRETNPDACIPSRVNPFDTYVTIPPENIAKDKNNDSSIAGGKFWEELIGECTSFKKELALLKVHIRLVEWQPLTLRNAVTTCSMHYNYKTNIK